VNSTDHWLRNKRRKHNLLKFYCKYSISPLLCIAADKLDGNWSLVCGRTLKVIFLLFRFLQNKISNIILKCLISNFFQWVKCSIFSMVYKQNSLIELKVKFKIIVQTANCLFEISIDLVGSIELGAKFICCSLRICFDPRFKLLLITLKLNSI
jgi:hypothetical protein